MNLDHKLRTLNAKILPRHMLRPPKEMVLGVNNVCNLHCKMCDVGTQNLESNFAINLVGTHPINMPKDLLWTIIDQTASFYPDCRLAYAFTEPLVYPHLVESIAYATEKGLSSMVTTNALVLRQKAFALVAAGLDEINISLDGPQDIHNEIRGNSKSFQKAMEGIDLLSQSERPPKINIICAITEWNIGHLQSFVESFSGYPISEIGFMHTQFTEQTVADHHNKTWGNMYPATDSNLDIVDLSRVDVEMLAEEIEAIKKKEFPFRVYFSPDLNSKELLQVYYRDPGVFIGSKCNAVSSTMMIKSDGSVIPAHGRCYNLDIGNIYHQNLKAIWNSSVLGDFRQTLRNEGGLLPACARCCSGFG